MSDRVLESDDTGLVEADEWAELEPKAAPMDVSAELQRQVDEFLAQGGKIKTFEPGETAVPAGIGLFPFMVSDRSTPSLRQIKADNERRLNQFKASREKDAQAIAVLSVALDTAQTGTELCKAVGCSFERLYRLFRDYFPDDKRTTRFVKRTHEERKLEHNELLLPKVKAAIEAGVVGIAKIAEHCGTHWYNVSQLNKTYRLNIPKEPSGRKPPKAGVLCRSEACGKSIGAAARYCPHCGSITDFGVASK